MVLLVVMTFIITGSGLLSIFSKEMIWSTVFNLGGMEHDENYYRAGRRKSGGESDFVTINMSMKTSDMTYDTAMDMAAEKIDGLSRALKHAGFEAGDLKTTKFRVDTAYDTIKDGNGNYNAHI